MKPKSIVVWTAVLAVFFVAFATVAWFSGQRTEELARESEDELRQFNTYGRTDIKPEEMTPEREDKLQAVRNRFESTGLQVGDTFPAAEIFDAAGKPFSTESFKGHYTVLVNGCLT